MGLRIIVIAVLLFGCKPEADTRTTAAEPAAEPALPECAITTALEHGIPGSPGHLIESPRNPNGDSELAALMRVMLDDLQLARERVLNGEAVDSLTATHRRIRCTWPTDPATRNGHFDSMARRYLDTVRSLEKVSDAASYEAVVGQCLHCHQNTCPGPATAIEKLRLPIE